MFRLTTDISFDLPTYDPFTSDTKSEHKSGVSDIHFTTELSTTIFFLNAPVGVLMSPLQITSQMCPLQITSQH